MFIHLSDTATCCSLNLTSDQITWADLLVPIGGDGTFLMAAGRASPVLAGHNRCTPVVGFNSDPVRSEGRLMLPKQYSHDPRAAVRKILEVIYAIRIRAPEHARLTQAQLRTFTGRLQVGAAIAPPHHAAGREWRPVVGHRSVRAAPAAAAGQRGTAAAATRRRRAHALRRQDAQGAAVYGAERGVYRRDDGGACVASAHQQGRRADRHEDEEQRPVRQHRHRLDVLADEY